MHRDDKLKQLPSEMAPEKYLCFNFCLLLCIYASRLQVQSTVVLVTPSTTFSAVVPPVFLFCSARRFPLATFSIRLCNSKFSSSFLAASLFTRSSRCAWKEVIFPQKHQNRNQQEGKATQENSPEKPILTFMNDFNMGTIMNR
jgi:hypothetical protein